MRTALLAIWTLVVLVVGFIAGVYALPILTAPKARPAAEVNALAKVAVFHGEFHRDLKGSDAFHWGEGTVSVGPRTVSLVGKVAPGPDYKLYLSPEFEARKLSNVDRVKALYLGGLGREPEPEALVNGPKALESGTTWKAFVEGLARSPEAKSHAPARCAP